MKCSSGRNDLHRKAIKQMAQRNYGGQEYACSNTMLNTHMVEGVWKIKHDSTLFINKTYTFIVHGLTIGFHIPKSLGLP